MPRPPIIGIAGKAQTGKDTVASFIIASIGGYRYGFADPIKRMVAALGIDMSDPYWVAHKEDPIPALCNVSPRQLAQTLGTEWGRDTIDPNFWVRIAHNVLLQQGPGMVVSDVRFDNEADWIRSLGGKIIHLSRPGATEVRPHTSEKGIRVDPALDTSLSNSGTLEELQATVREIVHGFHQT